MTHLDWSLLGVDGAELRRTLAHWPHSPELRDSEVGCALSHAAACRSVADQRLPYALIVEDDVILPHYIDSIVGEIGRIIRPGEVVSLYNRTIRQEQFSTVGAFPLCKGRYRLIYPIEARAMRTAAAYVVEVNAAERIAAYNVPARVVADNWATFFREGCVDYFSLAWPLPVKLVPFISTLESDRAGHLKRGLRAMNCIPLARNILSWRRGWITRKRESNLLLVDTPSEMSRR